KLHPWFEEMVLRSNELGAKANMAQCLSRSGLVTLQEGDTATARRLSLESLALHRETGNRWGISWVLSILARVEACQGDHTAALALYQERLAIARKFGSKLNIAFSMEGIASILVTQGEPVRTAWLGGAAEALRESVGAPIWPVERASYELSVAATRALLGERAFVTACAEGRKMPLDQTRAEQ